jgi:hypothetical protein
MTGKLQIKPKHIILITILAVIVGLLVFAGLWVYPRALLETVTGIWMHYQTN